MPSYFNENPSTDIYCTVEFTNKLDKTEWLKIYETSLFCHSAGLPHSVIDDNELPCRIVCFVGDFLTEPTENSVAICSGGLCDMGPNKSVQINLQQKNEFHGDPSNPSFDMIAPAPSCATVFAVGKVVAQVRGTESSLPTGWRCFDLRSSYYDNENKAKTRKYFTMRWFFPPSKRFDNTRSPQIDSVMQVTGQLLGRVVVQDSKYYFLGCLIFSLNYISTMGSTGTAVGRGLKEVVEQGDVKGGGSWSARARKREKLGSSSSIEGSRFGCLSPAFSLQSNTAMKRGQLESSSTQSDHTAHSDVDEDDRGGAKVATEL